MRAQEAFATDLYGLMGSQGFNLAFSPLAGFPVHGDFVRAIRRGFAADVPQLDFRSAPEGARTRVNAAVAKSTHDLIKQLMPPGSISPRTRLVITNAIYMKAHWARRFPKDRTRSHAFHAGSHRIECR